MEGACLLPKHRDWTRGSGFTLCAGGGMGRGTFTLDRELNGTDFAHGGGANVRLEPSQEKQLRMYQGGFLYVASDRHWHVLALVAVLVHTAPLLCRSLCRRQDKQVQGLWAGGNPRPGGVGTIRDVRLRPSLHACMPTTPGTTRCFEAIPALTESATLVRSTARLLRYPTRECTMPAFAPCARRSARQRRPRDCIASSSWTSARQRSPRS
jgi:hypothetical protein